MTLSLSDLRALPHLSVSRIKTFLLCPKRHALQYVEHVAPAFRPIALAFGSAFHDAVGAYLSGETDHDVVVAVFRDRLTTDVNAEGPPVLFDDDEGDLGTTLDAGIRMLGAFWSRVPVYWFSANATSG